MIGGDTPEVSRPPPSPRRPSDPLVPPPPPPRAATMAHFRVMSDEMYSSENQFCALLL